MRQYTTEDKSTWGDGPWQDEPDKVQWVDETTGLDCLIVRSHLSGALCGYVGIDQTHPLYGERYGYHDGDPDSKVVVHGGLTYSAFCQDVDDESIGVCHAPEPGRPHKVWWFGFDCAHADDFTPAMEAKLRTLSNPLYDHVDSRDFGATYKDIEYVRAEVTSLAAQLKALA